MPTPYEKIAALKIVFESRMFDDNEIAGEVVYATIDWLLDQMENGLGDKAAKIIHALHPLAELITAENTLTITVSAAEVVGDCESGEEE